MILFVSAVAGPIPLRSAGDWTINQQMLTFKKIQKYCECYQDQEEHDARKGC